MIGGCKKLNFAALGRGRESEGNTGRSSRDRMRTYRDISDRQHFQLQANF